MLPVTNRFPDTFIATGVLVFALGRTYHDRHGFVQLSGIGVSYVGFALLADDLRKSSKLNIRQIAWALTAIVLAPVALWLGVGAWALALFVLEILR